MYVIGSAIPLSKQTVYLAGGAWMGTRRRKGVGKGVGIQLEHIEILYREGVQL